MKNLFVLEQNDLSIDELAYQLTAYEQFGCIDYECGIIEIILDNYLEQAEASDLICKWNEYCRANSYYDDKYHYNDEVFFNLYFGSSDPMRIIQATHYGNYRYADDYVKFNGYGNLDSFDEYQVSREIKSDYDFKKWLLENDDFFEELLEEDNVTLITEKALKLVSEGY